MSTTTKPSPPAGTPVLTATASSIIRANGVTSPCGTLIIGEHRFQWEKGHHFTPHLPEAQLVIEDPNVPSRMDFITNPNWAEYLTAILGKPVSADTARAYSLYVADVIEHAEAEKVKADAEKAKADAAQTAIYLAKLRASHGAWPKND